MPHRLCTESSSSVSHALLTLGITIFQKVYHCDAPSMRAASSSASGSCSMNCFIRYSPSEDANAGMMIAHGVSTHPSFAMTR